jgi:hypothetical protein
MLYLFLDYGPWVEHRGGEAADVPGHNSAYKRELLLACGPELEALMEIETMFHWELHRAGHRFYVEPRAAIAHVNVSLPSAWLAERWHAGRVFAASRARRLVFVAGSPLIPLLRFRRIVGQIRRAGLGRRLPVLLTSLIVSAAGEMVGYAAGAGNSWAFVFRLELYKLTFVGLDEREAILNRPAAPTAGDPAAGSLTDRPSGTGA